MGTDSASGSSSGPGEVAELAAVDDPLRRLVQAAALLEQLRQRQLSVARVRDAAMAQLHGLGLSYADIAEAAGTTRGRVAQIVRRQRAGLNQQG